MTLGGDPEHLRDVARRLRERAHAMDNVAATVRRSYGIAWDGPASERYRDRIEQVSRDIGATCQETLDAADAVDRLADELAHRQALIAAAAARVEAAVAKAEGTLGGLAGRLLDSLSSAEHAAHEGARRLLDSLPARPPAGSPQWLDLARSMGA